MFNTKKEIAMSTTVTVGKRLIPIEHIALIEPFDAAAQSKLQTDRPFQARIVLIDRESVLTEEALAAFAEKHAFSGVERGRYRDQPGHSLQCRGVRSRRRASSRPSLIGAGCFGAIRTGRLRASCCLPSQRPPLPWLFAAVRNHRQQRHRWYGQVTPSSGFEHETKVRARPSLPPQGRTGLYPAALRQDRAAFGVSASGDDPSRKK